MLSDTIKSLVENEGLIFVGIVPLSVESDFAVFSEWLALGFQGSMHYLMKNAELRKDPRKIFPGAKTAILVGVSYFQGDTYESVVSCKKPSFAQFSRITDYHDLIKKGGANVIERLSSLGDKSFFGRVFVDSAPILERSLARKSGYGIIGKNRCFSSKEYGSFVVLGEIISTISLQEIGLTPLDDTASPSAGCQKCDACLRVCPTKALSTGYLDARKCLSYWTIENRNAVPKDLWPYFRHYVFGCDLCQLVCPMNANVPIAHSINALPRSFESFSLFDLATINHDTFFSCFSTTPVSRIGIDGLRYNALIAMFATNDPSLQEALKHLRKDPSPKMKVLLEDF